MAPSKTCFVTVGATASFSGLIRAVLSAEFFEALERHGYSELLVQYGKDGETLYNSCVTVAKNTESGSVLDVTGFALDNSGLGSYMRRAKGGKDAHEGVVISHAGSGTILDALRVAVPLIVVPNEELLDNHQAELAEALAEQEYVIHGKLSSLAQALGDAKVLRKKQRSWPPPNSGPQRKGLKNVIDEEMGYVDGS